jgi:transcriptional regulator with XRE-family HTH domain
MIAGDFARLNGMTNGTSELGVFLKARRAAVQPTDVGLPTGTGVRRTPGLRREEVAILSGVSVDYYTRLERGKETNPSPAVVDSLARILKLNPDEHEHLRGLVSHTARPATPQQERRERSRRVRPGPLALMEVLRPNPAYVVSRTNDVLAANPAGRALFHGIWDWPVKYRNITRYLFLHPEAKRLYPEWDKLVPKSVAYLRARAGVDPDDPDLVRLVGELVVKSPEFARMWERYEVKNLGEGTKIFQHPVVGAMTLDYEAMELANSDGQRLIAYYAIPGTPDHDAVVLLDMTGAALPPSPECAGTGGGTAAGSGTVAASGTVEGVEQLVDPHDGHLVERGDGPGVPAEREG